jgi:putative DNA primase/helicase
LNVPVIITNATDEYRGEMDVIGNFIRERCVQRPGAAIRARELFQVYQDWCDENNEMATSERMFGVRMKELGMVQKRTSEARFRRNGCPAGAWGFPRAPSPVGR